jgi:hypothetical protein
MAAMTVKMKISSVRKIFTAHVEWRCVVNCEAGNWLEAKATYDTGENRDLLRR